MKNLIETPIYSSNNYRRLGLYLIITNKSQENKYIIKENNSKCMDECNDMNFLKVQVTCFIPFLEPRA